MSNESIFEEIKDWVIAITIAVVLAFFIRYFIVELYKVSGPSMQPTLMGDERLVVNKFIYRFKEPAKGEITKIYAKRYKYKSNTRYCKYHK